MTRKMQEKRTHPHFLVMKNHYVRGVLISPAVIGRLVWVFGIPLIITWSLFSPFKKYDLKTNTNDTQYVSRTQINQNLTRYALADFFQTSLRLGWYDVCLEDHGAFKVKGDEDNGVGKLVSIQVKEVVIPPFMSDFIDLTPSQCVEFGSDNIGIAVGSSTFAMGPVERIPRTIIDPIKKEFSFSFTMDYTKMRLYVKQDPLALTTKYLVIVLLWGSITLLARSLVRFVQGEIRDGDRPN